MVYLNVIITIIIKRLIFFSLKDPGPFCETVAVPSPQHGGQRLEKLCVCPVLATRLLFLTGNVEFRKPHNYGK